MKPILNKILCAFLIISFAAVWGCNDENDNGDADITAQLRQKTDSLGLTGDPSSGREFPDINDPLPQLGMKLFFTKALGGEKDTACVSCHHPVLAGGDALSLSIGVGAANPDLLGPGRIHSSGYPNVPRNAPSTFNSALYGRTIFWDGRIESLDQLPGANGEGKIGVRTPDTPFGIADPKAGENLVMAQSRFPVTSVEEMRGAFLAGEDNSAVRDHLAARIGDYGAGRYELNPNQWLPEFQEAFNSDEGAETLITFENITLAISEYERSQIFVNTPWRDFVQGDDNAISASAKKGALLFFESTAAGGAGCNLCHAGDFFTDEQFHVLAVPQIGHGKGDEEADDDFGRFRESGDPLDKYAFRTPSLLNVGGTGPYGHDGAYTTLPEMVRHVPDPWRAVENYDNSQLDPSIKTTNMMQNTEKALAQLNLHIEMGLTPIQKISLSEAQVNDLVAFLHTLTDPCIISRDCLQKWIPDKDVNDPDGLRLNAIDVNGDAL